MQSTRRGEATGFAGPGVAAAPLAAPTRGKKPHQMNDVDDLSDDPCAVVGHPDGQQVCLEGEAQGEAALARLSPTPPGILSDPEGVAIAMAILSIYSRRNPAKLDSGEVDLLLAKYRGSEHLLHEKVHNKYLSGAS